MYRDLPNGMLCISNESQEKPEIERLLMINSHFRITSRFIFI